MRKARLIVGRTAVGILVLAGGAGQAAADVQGSGRAVAAEDLSARSVANSLKGEWDGQLEVRRSDGTLSTSIVSMSARLAPDGKRLELYYEGFAFGNPVEGAMVLSFANDRESLSLRDTSTGLRASCAAGQSGSSEDGDTLAMSGKATSGEVRAVFGRGENDSWNIEYHTKGKDGSWTQAVVMRINRLEREENSAASANFASSADLKALRQEVATASADTEK